MKGILDPQGQNLNPFTEKTYSQQYKDIGSKWSTLPAYKNRTQIIDQMKKFQVNIVLSGTGSGKTVLMPKYLAHVFDYKSKIAITLPKRTATKKAAQYAAATLDVKLGEHVGYQFKGDSKKGDLTQLLYSTDGSIVQMLLNDISFEQYDGIIIDEAHERKIQIDILLFLLRKTMKIRPNFKLVIMSATIDPKLFLDYFKEFKTNVIELSGQPNFEIKSIYREQEKDYVQQAFETIKEIISISDNKDGDDNIIVFVPTINDTRKICGMIQKFGLENQKSGENIKNMCITIHSKSNEEDIKVIGAQNQKQTRHIIISTNVAESSITLHNIKYVIDTGLELLQTYDNVLDLQKLSVQFTTKAQIIQRKGRTGRLSPGTCYHLYTKKTFEDQNEFPFPEILTTEPSEYIVKLFSVMQSDTTDEIEKTLGQLITPPSKITIKKGMQRLQNYQIIYDDKITSLGRLASQSRQTPRDFIILHYAYQLHCFNEVLVLLKMQTLSAGKLAQVLSQQFVNQKLGDKHSTAEIEKLFQKTFKPFIDERSDFLTFHNIYEAFEAQRTANAIKQSGGKKKKQKTSAKKEKNSKRNPAVEQIDQEVKTKKSKDAPKKTRDLLLDEAKDSSKKTKKSSSRKAKKNKDLSLEDSSKKTKMAKKNKDLSLEDSQKKTKKSSSRKAKKNKDRALDETKDSSKKTKKSSSRKAREKSSAKKQQKQKIFSSIEGVSQTFMKSVRNEVRHEKHQLIQLFISNGVKSVNIKEHLKYKILAAMNIHQRKNAIIQKQFKVSTFVKQEKNTMYFEKQVINGTLVLSFLTNMTEKISEIFKKAYEQNQQQIQKTGGT